MKATSDVLIWEGLSEQVKVEQTWIKENECLGECYRH